MLLDRDEKIDWFRVIIDLERSGYSFTSIATVTGAARSTIIGWKQGSTPRFEDGLRLIDLWEAVTKKSRETVHTVKRYSHLA